VGDICKWEKPTIPPFPQAGNLTVISCINNLLKGTANQAIQNMNLVLGLPEDTGL